MNLTRQNCWHKLGSTGDGTVMPRHRIFALLVVICFSSSLGAEEPDLKQRFVLLSTLRVSTLEKELKQAAGAGYRIQFASNEGAAGSGGGLPQAFTEHNQVILEKTGGAENLDYLFLKIRGESPANSITFLESDMNEAAAKGYRFRPRTFLRLMEKRGSDDSSPTPKYHIIQGSSKHLQEETCEASKKGFHFVDLISSVVVMERLSPAAGDAVASPNAGTTQNTACPYLVIGIRTEGAMRKEMAAGAASGYSVVAASCPGEIVVVMEKGASDVTKEYLILDSMRIGKLQRDMAEAADRSFRAIPRAFISYSVTNVAIMEKGSTTTSAYEYMILETQKSSTLQKKMAEATGQGFQPVAMNNTRTLLLEKNKHD